MTITDDVLQEVLSERKFQDKKWGVSRDQNPLEWFAILGEEFGEVAKNTVDANWAPGLDVTKTELLALRKELIQVAAVAVAWVECLDNFTIPQLDKYINDTDTTWTDRLGNTDNDSV